MCTEKQKIVGIISGVREYEKKDKKGMEQFLNSFNTNFNHRNYILGVLHRQ